MFCRELLLYFLLLRVCFSLTCNTFYDYTSDLVKCSSICPNNSTLIGNKCLRSDQYLRFGTVNICRGYVNPQKTLCCKQGQYSINNECVQCKGILFNNICCPSSTYLDLSTGTPKCTKLLTGPCSDFHLNSLIKICCGSQGYNIETAVCQSTQALNCDNKSRVCCSKSKYLDYVDNKYICTSFCSWSRSNSFNCQNRYCSQNNKPIISNQKISSQGLLAFGNQCCVGLTQQKNCIKNQTECKAKFINMGWSICCPSGENYNVTSKQCSQQCQGLILFEVMCIPTNFILDLTNSTPQVFPNTEKCHGKILPFTVPVCCLPNFYLNDKNGCQLCIGKIFKVSTFQVCCKDNQYFNENNQKCQYCEGYIDHKGTLCCSIGQVIMYTTSGVASCSQSCIQDNLYQTKFCCLSLTNSTCQNRDYVNTMCNLAYFQDNTCQVCPTLCSNNNNLCTNKINLLDNCTQVCTPSTVSFNGNCLQCHESCQKCSQPFNSNSCNSCKYGYLFQSGSCSSCQIDCQACQNTSNTCIACKQSSIIPVLLNNACVQQCSPSGQFYNSSGQCQNCDPLCLTCISSLSSSCTRCIAGKYLTSSQGACQNCSNSCSECFSNPSFCLKCSGSFVLIQKEGTCLPNCRQNQTAFKNTFLNPTVCLQCDNSCKFCDMHPQNCKECNSNSSYIQANFGISICKPCQTPCITCSSLANCSSCIDGYFLQQTLFICNRCHVTCQKCSGPKFTDCTGCNQNSQLFNGKCSGCTSICQTCNGSDCLRCKNSYFLLEGICFQNCPGGFFQSGIRCVQCKLQCLTCQNSLECLNCKAQYPFYLNGSCLSKCPQSYISDLNKKCIFSGNNGAGQTNNTKNQTTKITEQSFIIKDGIIYANIYFNGNQIQPNFVNFLLLNPIQNSKIMLRILSIEQDLVNNKITFKLQIPQNILYNQYSLLQTQYITPNQNISTFSSQLHYQLSEYQNQNSNLSGLKYMGLVFFIIIGCFSLLSKGKDHFIAEQSNTIILHIMNFIQLIYLFKFSTIHPEGLYNFLDGFHFANWLFFPNFFGHLIPNDYVQIVREPSLRPDANFIRNVGSVISFQIVVIGVFLLSIIISLIAKIVFQTEQLPQIRKIMRIGIFLISIGFLIELFFAFTQLIQTSSFQNQYESFYRTNFALSIVFICLIFILILLIFLHYFFTYFSDVLEHYYTLRQFCQLIILYPQTIIMMFAIGKPLLGLALIPIEILWLLFNIFLYRYAVQDSILDRSKIIVISMVIIISIIFLSLSQMINWIAIVVIVSLSILLMFIYCVYQIVGIYYHNFFEIQDTVTQTVPESAKQATVK